MANYLLLFTTWRFPQGVLQGDEAHVSGWDLVYDNNGYVETDPEMCGYSTYLGSAMASTRTYFETDIDLKADTKKDETDRFDGSLKRQSAITSSLRGKSKPK